MTIIKNIAILISGRGTNLQALLEAQRDKKFDGKVVVVISNKADALGIKKAKNFGIQTEIIEHNKFESRDDHEEEILKILNCKSIDLIVLAGYLRLLTNKLVKPFTNKIINIHPSLLPAFPGLHSQKQAIDYGVKISGCTTHFVDLDLDHGPIILQRCVEVLSSDTEDTLSNRILQVEHKTLIETVKLFCENRIFIEDRKVIIKN